MAELLKIDRNGSKHWRGERQCDRCGGHGYYAVGVHNGELVLAYPDDGICYKCGGRGKVIETWIERTPEYKAKLDAKREAKRAKEQAERAAEQAKLEAERKAREAERKAEEERIRAEKAISKYVGEIGQRITVDAEFLFSGRYERRSFSGFGTETVYIHNFKDANGNKLVWKTTCGTVAEEGKTYKLTGTIKEHSEYKDEKQTVLQRVKLQTERG